MALLLIFHKLPDNLLLIPNLLFAQAQLAEEYAVFEGETGTCWFRTLSNIFNQALCQERCRRGDIIVCICLGAHGIDESTLLLLALPSEPLAGRRIPKEITNVHVPKNQNRKQEHEPKRKQYEQTANMECPWD